MIAVVVEPAEPDQDDIAGAYLGALVVQGGGDGGQRDRLARGVVDRCAVRGQVPVDVDEDRSAGDGEVGEVVDAQCLSTGWARACG